MKSVVLNHTCFTVAVTATSYNSICSQVQTYFVPNPGFLGFSFCCIEIKQNLYIPWVNKYKFCTKKKITKKTQQGTCGMNTRRLCSLASSYPMVSSKHPIVLIITWFAGFVDIFKTSWGGYCCATTTTRLNKLNARFYKTRQHVKYICSSTEKELGYAQNGQG